MNSIQESLRAGGTPDFDAVVDEFAQCLPLLADLAATPQDPEWHGEGDVHTHTAWVLREVYAGLTPALEPARREALVLGAAFHDIAKPLTTREAERGGRTRIIAPRHADRGRSYLAGRTWAPTSTDDPPKIGMRGRSLWSEVLALVGHHHDPRQFVTRDEPRGRYWRLARSCDTELLYHLAVADMTGRACPDKAERLEELELFKMACQEYGCFGEDPYEGWRATFDLHAPNWSPDHLKRALAQGIRDLEAGRIQTAHEAIARGYGLADSRGYLYVLCGPSGCGKSSWVRDHLPGATIVSLDAIRGQLTGNPADQSKNGQVRQEAMRLLRTHLAAGRKVVYDATNLRRDFRRDVVALGWDYGALTAVVAFATPEEVCQKNNAARDRNVPRHIISRQFSSWEAPYLHEADAVRWVRPA